MGFKPTLFLLLLVFSISTGCATIFGSKNNTLIINTESGEKAEVWLDGERIGDAPGKIKVPAKRIQDGSILEVRAPGKPVFTTALERRLNKGYLWVDILTTFGVAAAVDMGTGYLYRPYPRRIETEESEE